MTEPNVALTDYALALECGLFVVFLQLGQARWRELRSWLLVFFASVSAASVCGGTVHGFFPDSQSVGSAILWPATLLALGVSALSAWVMGAKLLFSIRVARWVLVAAVIQFVLYSVVVVRFGAADFRIAIMDYFPAILFLLIALFLEYWRERRASLLLAAAGLVLTLVAALLQQLGVGIHPVYFNHNAFYHVLQAAALLLFFLGGRRMVRAGSDASVEAPSIKPPHAIPTEINTRLESRSGDLHADTP
jgi:hypothetical protein